MQWRWLACAVVCLSGVLPAQERQVWQGTLGGHGIVVELTAGADETDGRYFYERFRRDVRLSGASVGPTGLMLDEGDPWQEGAKPRWQLQRDEHGDWQGIWTNGDRQLPIVLHPARPSETVPDDDYRRRLRSQGLYDALRLQRLTLQRAERQPFMGRELQWWREPLSGMRFFTVVGASDAVNRRLQARLWEEVDAHLSCIGSDGDHRLTVTPQWLSDRLLSVNLFSEYGCSGAAHPDFGSAPLTLDLTTGRELALEDLLWLGQGEPLRPAAGERYSQPLADYREKTFAPWVIALFTQRYPTLMQKPVEGECDYRSAEVWQFAPWYLTPEGLYLGPTFFRAARNCDEPGGTLIPYAEVRQHPGPLAELLPH